MSFLRYEKPDRLPEANIQAELWQALGDRGIHCLLEYTLRGVGRFDIALLDLAEEYIVGVVEVKSYKMDRPAKRNTKQIAKYSRLGVEVFMCGHRNQIPAVADKIANYYLSLGNS